MVAINNYPLYLILTPLSVAFFLFMFKSYLKKVIGVLSFLTLLFNSGIALYVFKLIQNKPIMVKLANFLPPIGINLYVTGFNSLLVLIASIVGVFVSLYSLYYIKEGDKSRYYILLLLFFVGINGILLTGDIFNFFVFFEILTISAFALVGIENKKLSIEAGFKYLVQGSLGSLFILVGIGLIYSQVGTLNFADISIKIKEIDISMKYLIGIFFIVGLGIETALFPLNFWLPDAHSMAPSSISAILSGLAINAGLYGLLIISYIIFPDVRILFNIIFLLGIITMLMGEFLAFRQDNYKRMLAFSSTGQMGLVVISLFSGSITLFIAGLFQLFNHIFAKVLLFLSGGYILKNEKDYNSCRLNGAFYRYSIASTGIIVGALSLLGIPLTLGFYSKINIILGFSSINKVWIIILILLASLFEGFYFVRIIKRLFVRENLEKNFKIPFLINIIFILLILFLIVGGIYPYVGNISKYSKEFLDSTKILSEVLNG